MGHLDRILRQRFLLGDLKIRNLLHELLDRIHAVLDLFLVGRFHDLHHILAKFILQILCIKTLR